jgi:hypothetical protein
MALSHQKDPAVLGQIKLYLLAHLLSVQRLKFSFTSLHLAALKTSGLLLVRSVFLPSEMLIIVWLSLKLVQSLSL